MTPATLKNVPRTSRGVIDSTRCRNMCTSSRVINGPLALMGLTTVTGARLNALNKDATPNPWPIPASPQTAMYLDGTRRHRFLLRREP